MRSHRGKQAAERLSDPPEAYHRGTAPGKRYLHVVHGYRRRALGCRNSVHDIEAVAFAQVVYCRAAFFKLPGKLRETALLRKENPEATLQELAAMLEPPITKSAINHRMRKLLELARALEE